MTVTARILQGDCLDVLPTLGLQVDAVVTDPPYGLAFMGKAWDHGVPGVPFWEAICGAMKPGAHLLAFGGTRTHHRLMVAIEDAGFELRDVIMWVYGSGFPKSLDVSKAIDKRGGYAHLSAEIGRALVRVRTDHGKSAAWCDREFCDNTSNWSWFEGRPRGQRAPSPVIFARIVAVWPELASLADKVAEADREVAGPASGSYGYQKNADRWTKEHHPTAPATDAARQWDGWGTALKPAWEPIIVARKPLEGTVAANVLAHGVGGINVDASRIATDARPKRLSLGDRPSLGRYGEGLHGSKADGVTNLGRWPANLIHDGSDEVTALFPVGSTHSDMRGARHGSVYGGGKGPSGPSTIRGHTDSGSAARFFYCAKASKAERGEGNRHPTVKPLALMRYLVRLVTPPGGTVLDPFMGSGATMAAAERLGFEFIGIELDQEHCDMAEEGIHGPLFASSSATNKGGR